MIYANEVNGRRVHIVDADSEMGYACIYCNTDVRTKQGQEMPWHFAHLDTYDAESCSFPPNIGCILHIRHHDGYCKAGDICENECQYRR